MSHLARTTLVLALVGLLATTALAGKAVKWEDLPKPVRDTILARGGKEGPVDQENYQHNGLAVYEVSITDKDGKAADLVVAADGTLVEIKHDAADDAAAERAQRGRKLLQGVKFSHPTEITNPYLPLSSLKQDVLEGVEDGKKTRLERTVKPDVHRKFKVGDVEIDTLAVEDRVWEDGKLAEVALDYFAQDDAGTVYYLGEDVDEYAGGKVVGHKGSWLVGKDTAVPGVLFPGHPRAGDKFRSEDVSDAIGEKDEIVSMNEQVAVPAGKYADCVKIKEFLADGNVEDKYYAKGVGVVREVPHDGDVKLISHTTRQQ